MCTRILACVRGVHVSLSSLPLALASYIGQTATPDTSTRKTSCSHWTFLVIKRIQSRCRKDVLPATVFHHPLHKIICRNSSSLWEFYGRHCHHLSNVVIVRRHQRADGISGWNYEVFSIRGHTTVAVANHICPICSWCTFCILVCLNSIAIAFLKTLHLWDYYNQVGSMYDFMSKRLRPILTCTHFSSLNYVS